MATYNLEKYNRKLRALRDYYISELQKNIKDVRVNGDMENRLPGNINVSFKNIDGGELLLKLDEVRNMCFWWFSLQFRRA